MPANSQKYTSLDRFVSPPNFSAVKVIIPAQPEQEAIAGILQTGDSEIEKLTQHLENLRRQKKALMQQLLTGKRRLKVAA